MSQIRKSEILSSVLLAKLKNVLNSVNEIQLTVIGRKSGKKYHDRFGLSLTKKNCSCSRFQVARRSGSRIFPRTLMSKFQLAKMFTSSMQSRSRIKRG